MCKGLLFGGEQWYLKTVVWESATFAWLGPLANGCVKPSVFSLEERPEGDPVYVFFTEGG